MKAFKPEEVIGSHKPCEKLIGEELRTQYRRFATIVNDYIRQLTNRVDFNGRGDGITYGDILQHCPEVLHLVAKMEKLYRCDIDYPNADFVYDCTRIIRDKAVRTSESEKSVYIKILPGYKYEIFKDCRVSKIPIISVGKGYTTVVDHEIEIIADHYGQFIDFNEDSLFTDKETAAKIAVFIYWCNYRFPADDNFVVQFKEIYWHDTLDAIWN